MAQRTPRNAKSQTAGRRDPEATRELILKSARELMSRDGAEGLSVAEVARHAGVNRGTAYHHFQTREQLIDAATRWVSETLHDAVLDNIILASHRAAEAVNVEAVIGQLAEFAMRNPELGRVWLYELLNSRQPANDKFWRTYRTMMERFAESDEAQPGIDVDVHSIVMLAGTFLWPVWVRAHARTAKERQEMTERFTREIVRLTLHGTLRPEKFAALAARVSQPEEQRPALS
ncbi:MAG TPA: TetR/AcrR family transcriptional regulator [Povalibacter sp.]|uniref:TetR/AcrR family transcriptional regulator n=1 Tax=Povalibacter sp. TaxID=1962978 RepID=UPI002BE6C858|nr:TetR/AcrR family transcriptional regulator [Povalibacter sp.]HMN43641.1 TetR/AcrR family transcriptional regulator [Povalibacter sp.]